MYAAVLTSTTHKPGTQPSTSRPSMQSPLAASTSRPTRSCRYQVRCFPTNTGRRRAFHTKSGAAEDLPLLPPISQYMHRVHALLALVAATCYLAGLFVCLLWPPMPRAVDTCRRDRRTQVAAQRFNALAAARPCAASLGDAGAATGPHAPLGLPWWPSPCWWHSLDVGPAQSDPRWQ